MKELEKLYRIRAELRRTLAMLSDVHEAVTRLVEIEEPMEQTQQMEFDFTEVQG